MATPSICIPNIGPRERRRRLIGAVVFFAIAAILTVCMIWFNAPRPWRLVVFLPAWASALGVFQVREQTCVALAARGLRNMDDGDEKIENPQELDRVRAQSKRVHLQSILSAAIIAAALFLFPI